MLAIEGQSASISKIDAEGYTYYRVKFLLRETTGVDGVTVESVQPVSPDGIDEGYIFGPQCFPKPLRVPAGGTLDVFYTDAGLMSLGSCAPQTWGKTPTTHLDLVVMFNDDNGHRGRADAVIELH